MTCGEGTFCNSDDNGAFCEDLNECMLVESCPTMDHQCENINCAIEECQVFGDGFICHEPQVGCKPIKKLNFGKLKISVSNAFLIFFFKIAWTDRNQFFGHIKGSRAFKGSPDPKLFIFEINVGKRRIRHRTTLNLEFLDRLKID